MDVKEQELRIYVTPDGRAPFIEWHEGLKDREVSRRIQVRISRVRAGNFGDCKSVGDGVFELRFMHGPGYRTYLGRDGDKIVILLSGGDKGTQDKDIETAKEYWAEYKEEKRSHAY